MIELKHEEDSVVYDEAVLEASYHCCKQELEFYTRPGDMISMYETMMQTRGMERLYLHLKSLIVSRKIIQ